MFLEVRERTVSGQRVYREAVGGDDLNQPPHSDASLAQMIEAILAREDVDLSTTGIMRAIAA